MIMRFCAVALSAAAISCAAWAGPDVVEGADAGSVPENAARPGGSGAINTISGELNELTGPGLPDLEDMYLIEITDPASFRVRTFACDGTSPANTQLYLFSAEVAPDCSFCPVARGVLANDDAEFLVPGTTGSILEDPTLPPGPYYLVITIGDSDPRGMISDCCAPNGGMGCDTPACETIVCNNFPNCCAIAWDAFCAGEAQIACDVCTNCEGTSLQPIFDPLTTCMEVAQANGPAACAVLADWFQPPSNACVPDNVACPGTGDCFLPNGTPGCAVESCCEVVCEQLPDCCTIAWDAACADQAGGSCDPPGIVAYEMVVGGAGFYPCPCDFNTDGVINVLDLIYTIIFPFDVTKLVCVIENWNDVCVPPPASPVGPCVDFVFTAPLLHDSDTCGTGDDCPLRPSEEVTYQIEIPNAGDWTFSLCGSTFDTVLHLGSTCCADDLGVNDDFCGLQSELMAFLAPGLYYLTIEGFNSVDCGGYTLQVDGPPPGGGCGDPGSGDCFVPNGSPACDNLVCCEQICLIDPFCCAVDWGPPCANLASICCVP